jgi:hypothetical protein
MQIEKKSHLENFINIILFGQDSPRIKIYKLTNIRLDVSVAAARMKELLKKTQERAAAFDFSTSAHGPSSGPAVDLFFSFFYNAFDYFVLFLPLLLTYKLYKKYHQNGLLNYFCKIIHFSYSRPINLFGSTYNL